MLEKTYRISSYDVNPSGLIKISALQKYMQQLAREDCNGCGATYEDMRGKNMVFVITKLGLEIYEDIRSEDVITVRTYNNRVEGVHFNREYQVFKDGKLAAAASTFWVLLNYEQRTVLRPRVFDYPLVSYNKETAIDIPRRLFDKDGVEYNTGARKVMFSDLDENNHLNNCVYSDIALDMLTDEPDRSFVKKVNIIFISEAVLGEELNISIIKSENSYYLNAYNQTADKPCFEAELVF